MNVLNIAPHYGGGIGAVVSGLIKNDTINTHKLYSLELCKDRKVFALWAEPDGVDCEWADIVLVHYWPHPILKDFLSKPLPPCRLIAWCHHNVPYSQAELDYPDLWLDTSPVQGHGRYIWSCGDISRFLEIKPKAHDGFNVGYAGTVDFKKLHPNFFDMCCGIEQAIQNVHFTVVGENKIGGHSGSLFTFTGKVDDVAPYLAEFDCFFYPLRPDHTGTAEQVLGESMAAGVVPVVLDNAAERLIIRDGVDGFIASSESKFIHYIKMLYEGDRTYLSNNARARARELYNIDHMISEWNAVFEEVMKMPKRKRVPL